MLDTLAQQRAPVRGKDAALRRAHGAHAFHVESVARAELELQPQEAVIDLGGTARHVVGIAEPDRPRGRRSCTPEPEQPPDGNARELPLQVVYSGVERSARCEL